MSKVWMITGAGRGMGLDFAKAVLAAGDKLVATGRNPERVAKAIGQSENLLTVTLDVTKPADADAAVKAALERFGRIDMSGQQCRELLRGLLRGADPGPDRSAACQHSYWPDERHPRCPAGDAQAGVRQGHLDLVDGQPAGL